MCQRARKSICVLLTVVSVLLYIMPLCHAQTDMTEYDKLRIRWVERLTGGDYIQTGEVYREYILPKVNSASNAGKKWNDSMASPSQFASLGYLWSDLQMGDTKDEYHRKARPMSQSFERIEEMALAYRIKGSALEGNAGLKSNIIAALEYMYTAKYNEKTPRTNRNLSPSNSNENWYEWEIRAPEAIVNILALMYEEIPQSLIDNLLKGVDKQVPEIGAAATGANRLDNSLAAVIGGIVQKNPDRLQMGIEAIRPELTYSTADDGFYADGTFIQHHQYPYNGSYGVSALSSLAEIVYLLENSSLMSGNLDVSPLYQWVYDSFEPLQYEGRMMDGTRGRSISRRSDTGYGLMEALVILCEFAPAEHAAHYASMIKRWCEKNNIIAPYGSMNSIFTVSKLYEILNDASVAAQESQNFYRNFGAMDRAVLRRENFAVQISMYSDRIRNYESINGENLRGWHTASGAVYLYNDDLDHYNDDYWPTVDSHRLAGTTVVKESSEPNGIFGDSFAGGVEKDGRYGVNAMRYNAPSDASSDGGAKHDLTAQKAWFALDEEIVCLGSGITSSVSGDEVETVVENRKVDTTTYPISINGTRISYISENSEEYKKGVQTAHIKGNMVHVNGTKSTDLGYYFPQPVDLTVKREQRTDCWRSIGTGSTATTTREYISFGLEHGIQPQGAGYAYAMLPGKSALQLQQYAAAPNFTVLSNTTELQAVRKNDSGLLGAVVWNGGQQVGNLLCHTPSLVMLEETEEFIKISVSDPRQTNGTLKFTLNQKAAGVRSADIGVTAQVQGDKTTISVDTADALGKTFHIVLSKKKQMGTPDIPSNVSAQVLSPTALRVSWNAQSDAERYYLLYSETENGEYYPVPNFDGNSTEYIHKGLQPEKNYYYQVAAGNANGVSSYSATVCGRTSPIPQMSPVYDCFDTFDDYMAGPVQYQRGWTAVLGETAGNAVDVVSEDNGTGQRLYFHSVSDTDKTKSTAKITKQFYPLTGVFTVEGDFNIPDSNWKNLFVLYGSNNKVAVQLYSNNGKLHTYNGESYTTKHPFLDFTVDPKQTYHIKVTVNVKTRLFEVSVDGKVLQYSVDEPLTFRNAVSDITKLECGIGDIEGDLWLDNLSVTPNTVQFLDFQGNAWNGMLQAGAQYTAQTAYVNRSTVSQKVRCMIRLQNADGIIAVYAGEEKEIPAESSQTFNLKMTLPENCNTTGICGEVFFWQIPELEPLCSPVPIWCGK